MELLFVCFIFVYLQNLYNLKENSRLFKENKALKEKLTKLDKYISVCEKDKWNYICLKRSSFEVLALEKAISEWFKEIKDIINK